MWYPLKVFLTKAQHTWLKTQCYAKRKNMPDLIQDIIDHARLSDVNSQLIELEKYKQLLMKDALTNLYSRYYFDEAVKAIERGKMYPVSVVIADLDGLKVVNDTLGHRYGDELLKRAAEILKSSFREEDIVARIGGDEFAILLPFTPQSIVEKRYQVLCELMGKQDFTMSVGYATTEGPNRSLVKLIEEADQMMYGHKKYNTCRQ